MWSWPWIKAQWNDVKGDVKFAGILLVLSAIVSTVVALTHGLAVWQQFALALCFVLMFAWAVIATWMARSNRPHAQGFMQAVPLGIASAAQGVAIVLVQARPEPEPKEQNKLQYKRKITILLRNDTGSEITVSAPDYVSNRDGVPFHPPFWSIVQNEKSAAGGWRSDKWHSEQPSIVARAGEVFRARIGLSPGFSPEDISLRLNTQRVGTLILPVKLGGQEHEWRVAL